MKPNKTFIPLKKWLITLGTLLLACCRIQLLDAATIENIFNQIKHHPNTLYAFLQQMPKGGDLHTHFDGSTDVNTLIALAKKGNYCIDPKTYVLSQKGQSCQGVPVDIFLRNPRNRDTIQTAWSMEKLTVDDPERYDHFFDIFQKVAPIYHDFTTTLLADMILIAAQQHELYLEIIMMHPRQTKQSIPAVSQDDSQQTLEEKRQHLLADPQVQKIIQQQVFLAENNLKQARKRLGCETNPSLPACAVTVKFQYFVLRENAADECFADALIGFETVQRSTSIVGINLVQPEKGQRASADFQKQMQIFAFLHQAYPKVPISLHAGELTPGMIQNKTQRNHIQDSIHLGHATRIGHGAALFAEEHYHDLLKSMAEEGITVEINLTSNQDVLSLRGKHHPFLTYLQYHVPVVLSTDDAGISQTNLSQEFYKATQQYALDYATIKQINRNALTYSFLPGDNLWLNPAQQIRVPACRELMSDMCQKFIEKSQKAQLQWELEKKLADFEAHWTSKHVP